MDGKMRNGDWMQTYTGKKFYPLDPEANEIDIVDIAHALSMLCRYGGHCTKFYSVAEHSTLVSLACTSENALWGLLHDASEAYLVDVPKPIKSWLTNYKEIERKLTQCIAKKFNLSWPIPEEVRHLDYRILGDEKTQIMTSGLAWYYIGDPIGVKIVGKSPEEAERDFLEEFEKCYLKMLETKLRIF